MGQYLDNEGVHGFELPEDEEERNKKIEELKKSLLESNIKGFQLFQKEYKDKFKIEE